MPLEDEKKSDFPKFLLGGLVFVVFLGISVSGHAQWVPTVQQNQFRSQWVGEQVDQLPLGGSVSPFGGLQPLVGSLQTPDEVQREVDASLAAVKSPSPFSFKPSLGVGWEINNQGSLTSNNSVQTTTAGTKSTNASSSYGTANSIFLAPAGAFLFDRDQGPWNISFGYSAGYKYFLNPNFVGGGDGGGGQRNPLSQTAFIKTMLAMSRYVITSMFNASEGTGYDISSGSNNRQTSVGGTTDMKYTLGQYSALGTTAGYSLQNSSQSSATPNNNTTSLFGNFAPEYDFSDKTHVSLNFGAGRTSQSLGAGTSAGGTNAPLTSYQITGRNYAQSLVKVKYDFTGKLTFNASLGARYVTSSGITNSTDNGLSPAWSVGMGYSPTEKTSATLSAGIQGADVTPGLSFMLNWNPREKTQCSLGVSQTQNFANSVSSQYLVSRNIIGTITQILKKDVLNLNLSAGYTTQTYVNLSANSPGQNTSQLPSNFYIAQAALIWRIRDSINLSNSLYYNTGQSQSGAGNSGGPAAQAWYSISLNFAL
jgi:hypothetical protein